MKYSVTQTTANKVNRIYTYFFATVAIVSSIVIAISTILF